MYTLLFADDERIIREGMQLCVNWEQIGITWLDAAKNGREALDKVIRLKPDIVIIDIKMPKMTGLEVIHQSQGLEKCPEFIIYSGYDEFEFARQAMQYGVRHYLLKPINERQLIQRVTSVICKLDGKKPTKQVSIGYESLSLEEKIHRYVQEHIAQEHLTLQKICSQVIFMNPKYVSRAFYQKTGKRFKQYLLEQRIKAAKQLMESSPYSRVADVATRVGLNESPQYFSRIFKQYTGYTPSEYQLYVIKKSNSPNQI